MISRAFKAKIMVVEDEKTAALDIQKILQNLGHSVTSIAFSGEEALKELESLEKPKKLKDTVANKPDLVLIDNVLHGRREGIKVARQIRSRFDIPVVYLMDPPNERILKLAKTTEPFGYILKPFDEREFRTNIEMALDKQAIEKELKEKEERLSLFMDCGSDCFLLLDSELNVVEINETVLKNYHLSRKDLVGKNILDLFPDLKKTGRYDIYLEVIKTGEPYFEDCLAIHPKVGDRFVNLKAFKVGDGLGMIITDITDIKKAEQAIRTSRERFWFLVESMNEGLIMLDENDVITYINDRFLEMNGFEREKIIGYRVTDFLDRANKKIYREQTARQKKGESGRYEVEWKRKDGGKVFTIVSPEPIFDTEGNFKGSISLLTDITDHYQVEEELKKSHEQLRNLSLHLQSVREGERTRIAREIHDELGQLLTALKMDLSWLNKRITNGQKPLLDKTESMSELTDMIIKAVQRISTELRPGILDDLGLVPAIEWQAQEFENRAKIKCEITIDCTDIDLDQDRSTALFRIFQEALTNVARHANAKKIKVCIKEKPGKLLLKIKDNGRGITEEQISDPKSFGLIGMRDRIYPWGGEVRIKGISDKGTTVTVILPVERMQAK